MKDWIKQLFSVYFVRLFPLAVVFVGSLFNPADSDLGWHLRYGEYFFRHHAILTRNLFSSEMVNYDWVNHSWGTDIITYFTYHHFGFFGLSVLGALVVVATMYFFSKAAKLNFWQQAVLFPILLYLEEPLTIISFRSQLMTLGFIGLVYFFISKFEEKKYKWLFGVVPMFLVWSNLHGEFILGLGVFAGWIGIYTLRLLYDKYIKKLETDFREWRILTTSFLLSFAATFINPFTWRVYQEAMHHFDNPLQKYIVEWTPFDTGSTLWWRLVYWGILLALSLIIIAKKKQLKRLFPYISLMLLLFVFSFWMRRYTWPMFLVSIPVVAVFVKAIEPPNKKISAIFATFLLAAYYFYSIFIHNQSALLRSMSWDFYCKIYIFCSPKSAQYLVEHKPAGKMLTFYNWGGWLIWNYPDIKPSMDGRMPFWKDDHGYSAFAHYYPLEQNMANVDASEYDEIYIPPTKPIYKQMLKLVDEGRWKIVYQDIYAGIFVRNDIKQTIGPPL